MKKLVILAAAAALALPMSAQGFLGKLKKAIEPEKPAQTETKAPARDWTNHFGLDVVSCEGDPVSGEVLLTLVAQKRSAKSLEIGGYNQNFAVDAAGKRYTLNQLNARSRSMKELFDGIPQRYQMLATGVTPATPAFPLVTLSFYANGDPNLGSNMADVDPISLNDIAINWAPVPENGLAAVPWQLKEICSVGVASCTRNPDDNTVTLVIAASSPSAGTTLNLNDGRPIDVYDLMGNTYAVTYDGTEGVMGRTLDPLVPTRFVYTITGLDPAATEVSLAKIPFYAVDNANDLRAGSNMADISPIIIRSIPIANP